MEHSTAGRIVVVAPCAGMSHRRRAKMLDIGTAVAGAACLGGADEASFPLGGLAPAVTPEARAAVG